MSSVDIAAFGDHQFSKISVFVNNLSHGVNDWGSVNRKMRKYGENLVKIGENLEY